MKHAIETHNLNVAFGESPILKDIDFYAPACGITALVGRSGSGKSTLLRQFNRLNETFPDYAASGSVLIELGNGLMETMSNMPIPLNQLRRRVGMVFQTPDILPVSIRRNILIPCRVVAGLDKDRSNARMEEALKKTELWDEVRNRLDTPADTLSGGQKQRLCLARALALEPAILLLDEPTASLDVMATAAIEQLMLQLGQIVPLVVVTHNPRQAALLAKNIAVMREGRLVWQKECEEPDEDFISSLL